MLDRVLGTREIAANMALLSNIDLIYFTYGQSIFTHDMDKGNFGTIFIFLIVYVPILINFVLKIMFHSLRYNTQQPHSVLENWLTGVNSNVSMNYPHGATWYCTMFVQYFLHTCFYCFLDYLSLWASRGQALGQNDFIYRETSSELHHSIVCKITCTRGRRFIRFN